MTDPICSAKAIGHGRVNVTGDHERIDEILRMLARLPREIGGAIQTPEGRVYGTVLQIIERRGFLGHAVLTLAVEDFEIRAD